MEQRIYIYKVCICENSFPSVYCLFMQICYVSEWTPGPELHEATMRTGTSAVHREGLGAGNWDMQVHRNNTSRKLTLQGSKQALGALTTPNDVKKQVRFPDSLACSQEFTQGIPSRASLSQATSWKLVWAALQQFCDQPRHQVGSNPRSKPVFALGIMKQVSNRTQCQVFQAKI
ncbi:hypothetical protein SS50377_21443 [Spironucleus salmonicida]|uniref:Uncharacterized protein n=1 Tax=Spironucleus salmonicida TaxID=348837 RepID=V6LNX4_9EUKA|nr:hypothetical protein SS50377_21443 [Spironucleus salmonicida]|eukprot:EST42434.1 Hypothetical protein SS50377_17995 [Spironucleus salmonicida]